MDTPQQRTIRIGDASVGLIGLDIALNELAGRKDIGEDEAVAILYERISRANYIPAAARQNYLDALRREWRRLTTGAPPQEGPLVIRVLGRPCISCNKIKDMLIDLLQEHGIAADIEDVHDLDEIWRFGITQTPALIINGRVKSAGFQPTRSQIEKWLMEEAGEEAGNPAL